VGRLTPSLRRLRADPLLSDRVTVTPRMHSRRTTMRDVLFTARDAGRSCYLRPLFDRPRRWAAQRAPRLTATIHK
jgi:hypothetical protein